MVMQLTFKGMKSKTLTSWLVDFLANHSVWQETGKDFTIQGEHSFLISQGFYPLRNLNTWCLKTLKVCYLTTRGKPFPEYLPFLANWGIKLNTGYLIANIMECHKIEKESSLQDILENQVDLKYYVSKKLMNTLIKHKKRNIEKGNGFGFSLADRNGITNTMRSRYGIDGSEILIPSAVKKGYETAQPGDSINLKYLNSNTRKGRVGKNIINTMDTSAKHVVVKSKSADKTDIRRLTPVECERLQGFPDNYTAGVSDSQRYKCLGNAVTTNVITALFNQLFKDTVYDRTKRL